MIDRQYALRHISISLAFLKKHININKLAITILKKKLEIRTVRTTKKKPTLQSVFLLTIRIY